MGAVAGVVGSGEAPVRRTASMLAVQRHRAPGTTVVWPVTGGALGHAALRLASDLEPHLEKDEPSGVTLTADLRLDNRRELLSALGVDPRTAPGDAELALLCYLRWGDSFAQRLLGAFAIAVWDPRTPKLVLSRDHFGVRPLIYAANRSEFVFASTVDAVYEASNARHPVDLDKALYYLSDYLERAEPARTVLQGIDRVPRASYLVWTPGERPRIQEYWHLVEPQRLELGSDGEYREAFTELFEEAVRCRLRSETPVASMLSGGLDSSAVVATTLASGSRVRSYCGIEDDPVSYSDTPFIDMVVDHLGLDAVRVSLREIVEGYDLDAVLSSPDSLFDSLMAVMGTICERAASVGDQTLLTGLGADEVLYARPHPYAWSLLRRGRLPAAWREVTAAEGEAIPARRAARSMVAEAIPAGLLSRRRTSRALAGFSSELRMAGLAPESAAGRRLITAHEGLRLDPRWTTENSRLNLLRRTDLLAAAERYDRVAARFGVEVRHPFLDRRLVEFCLSLPPEQLRRLGWSKWVLRDAMASALPSAVVWRPKSHGALSVFGEAVVDHHLDAIERRQSGLSGPEALGPLPLTCDRPDAMVWSRWQRAVLIGWWRRHGA